MPTVFANGRSILHKGDGNSHVSAPPDVCKVPTPGGPVPTPFVNTAQDSMLAKGSRKTKIENNPVALSSSELSTSTGDEPGTAGGLISSKFKGKLTWSGASTDVKVEGKGVVRFMDPTMHNGNTFNTAFISAGGTGLAYGDDSPCDLCGKSVETHRVLETATAFESVELIFKELAKRFKPQRPLIEEFRALQRECAEVIEDANRRARTEEPNLKVLEDEVNTLTTQVKSASKESKGAIGKKLGEAQKKLAEKRAQVSKIRKDAEALNEARRARMRAINSELGGMSPVLREDEATGTYTQGYMVGACICKCPDAPRMLAACSGEATAGFKNAVAATPFTRVDSFAMTERQAGKFAGMNRRKWECAAPKLLQAGGASGHKTKTMSERFYAEAGGEVSVSYSRTEGKTTIVGPETFAHGESVPSCETCQALVPEMLCNNDKPCA